jgi:hypothetical protein
VFGNRKGRLISRPFLLVFSNFVRKYVPDETRSGDVTVDDGARVVQAILWSEEKRLTRTARRVA